MRTTTDTSLVIIIHNSNWKNKSHNYSRNKTPKHIPNKTFNKMLMKIEKKF